MPKTNYISDFLPEDLAYLLGLIVGRGEIIIKDETRRIIIEFPFKNLKAKGIARVFDTKDQLRNSLDGIINRLHQLGLNVIKDQNGDKISITWHNEDTAWLLIKYLLNGRATTYHSFRIPEAIFKADSEVKKEFIRGIFDVTGQIRTSNADPAGKHRVYLEIDQQNWMLCLDLYKLFQSIDIPVANLNFGHPNLRDPESKQSSSWDKGHQFKVYANHFLTIGSYIKHKNDVLEELAALNPPQTGSQKGEPRIKVKPQHPDELSDKLPEFLRGKHFDHYTEILVALEVEDKKHA